MDSMGVSSTDRVYKFRALSVDHLGELQECIDELKRAGKLSSHRIYRSYLRNKKFEVPRNLPDAKSLIVVAAFTKLMLVDFHANGRKHEVMVPPQYYSTGLTEETLRNLILERIIVEPGYKIEEARRVHLKLLAARSGLGRYGRNNLCYVEGMGSLLTLFAYFTDCQLEDNWTEMRMMDYCKECRICMSYCPTNCITEENFVIDAGKCLSLYNEIAGEFPRWIGPKAHNALMGCMKCQLHCPANREVIKQTGRFEDVTEEETAKILKGTLDDKLLDSLSRKLREFDPTQSEDTFPILTRNLGALLNPKIDLSK
ncbi:MAG: epoxyqueuosine reductase [Candidatus Bathyarchaeota archaeon]|nr:MAG: epoxyqueuosine reductase [Candidatus Bathyarchaeota archaeon]